MAMDISGETPLQHFRATNLYRYYVLGMMILVGAFAWIDRQILSIVLESLKAEFTLSDTQLGLLGGVAFGLFYVAVAVPVASLADRLNRRTIIALSMGLWSVMTALCGLSTGYTSLFFARMGVGVGEAGAGAPSQALLGDYFPPERRGLVMGLLYSYIPLSYLVAYGLGGRVNDAMGWRMAFIIFGLPGVLIAIAVRLTVREPPRGLSEPNGAGRPAKPAPRFAESLKYILGRRSLRLLPIAGAAHSVGMVGASVWLPAYFVRVHHMTSATVGMWLALIYGIAGLAGALSGGHLADRLAAKRNDERWYAWICAIAVAGTLPFTVAMYLTGDPWVAFALFVVPAALNHMLLGPVFAAVQNLAGLARRALAAACYMFVVNLVAMGLGPTIIGIVSDLTHARFGSDSLRYSLVGLICCANVISTTFFLLSAKSMNEDLASARMDDRGALRHQ